MGLVELVLPSDILAALSTADLTVVLDDDATRLPVQVRVSVDGCGSTTVEVGTDTLSADLPTLAQAICVSVARRHPSTRTRICVSGPGLHREAVLCGTIDAHQVLTTLSGLVDAASRAARTVDATPPAPRPAPEQVAPASC